MNKFLKYGVLLAASGLPGLALAATDTDTFAVTATVVDSCSVSANDLDFGNYDPLALAATTASTTIDVTCTLLAPFTVALDSGVNGADIDNREMSDGSAALGYQLFSDAPLSTVFGDGLIGSTVAGVGAGPLVPVNVPVFGQIPLGQNMEAGSYSDTITVTLTF